MVDDHGEISMLTAWIQISLSISINKECISITLLAKVHLNAAMSLYLLNKNISHKIIFRKGCS